MLFQKKIPLILLSSLLATFILKADPVISKEYTKGYVCAKLEDRFENFPIEFDIEDSNIIFYNWPSMIECGEIENCLGASIPYSLTFDRSYVPLPPVIVVVDQEQDDDIFNDEPVEEGSILPEIQPFFPSILSDPRILGYSVAYRSYDKVFKVSCIPVSIGDQFSLYQFKTRLHGSLYFGIEACVWAIFEGRTKSLSLINADYYVGFPLTYIHNKFSAKLRIFHESSHLGDEFLLEHKHILRRNPSMEVVDLSLAYEFTDHLTAFLGYSRVLRSDETFRVKPNTIYYGFNYFFDSCKLYIANVESIPYISAYCTNRENNKWDFDSFFAIGYEWNKSYGHKLRIYVEGHDGYSVEGQFSKEKTRYVALKLLYGY